MAEQSPPPDSNDGLVGSLRYLWVALLIGIAVLFVWQQFVSDQDVQEIPYSQLKERITRGDISKVTIAQEYVRATPTEDAVKLIEAGQDPFFIEAARQKAAEEAKADSDHAAGAPGQAIAAVRAEGEAQDGSDADGAQGETPENAEVEVSKDAPTTWVAVRVRPDDSLVVLLDEKSIPYEAVPEANCEGGALLLWLLPLLLLMFFWSSILGRVTGGGTQAMTFGRSKHRLYAEEGTGVTFDDVAGCDEAKEELAEVVEFLKTPERFSRLGGQMPRGVMLVGPPGTGKTLLAKAVAGEAGVTFFNISGSDFVEMFVGVGASRVRDLFKQAQEHSPCIIFVDELDAIGKARGVNAMNGGNDEREQTLNALLVEMDGFDPRSGVILVAATNRPEILDPALLRPGRFDRQVLVDRPGVRGREAILRVHARKVVLGEEVDLAQVATQTPGFVGADLANIVNEAALLAARAHKDAVEMADLNEAIERVVAGLEKKSRRLSPKEKRVVAFHESGHAIVGAAMPQSDPVLKISIIPRGISALGYTYQVPLEDRYLMTTAELVGRICTLLGGRVAEELTFGEITTGASNDLERVADLARRMITQYAMSPRLPRMALETSQNQNQFLGGGGATRQHYGPETGRLIDQEVQNLVESCYEVTRQVLSEHQALLDEMSEHLLEHEILEGDTLKGFLKRVDTADLPTL